MTAPPPCLKYGTLPKRWIQRAGKKSIVIGLVRGRGDGRRPHPSRGELSWPNPARQCLTNKTPARSMRNRRALQERRALTERCRDGGALAGVAVIFLPPAPPPKMDKRNGFRLFWHRLSKSQGFLAVFQ
jgi:hypothetical protein